MRYQLNDTSHVHFLARAPLHTFQGQATGGLRGSAEFDLENRTLDHIHVLAATAHFDTGDAAKNQAMADFFSFSIHPEADFLMTRCLEFKLLPTGNHRITVQGILTFAGIRRQLPITAIVSSIQECVLWDLHFKWSFSAYGLQAPSLLLMRLRDIVDIHARLAFTPTLSAEEEQ
ncbi:YceI family protein [Desulfobulbus alkaliphilus]|uniref:YceI family protein n=1 Tax=Desulfobulbus alkaliphilus TaxID=869814 RepID=UPI0019632B32|nr:YceI family protein [Desulfobulbus alkaliphilus]